MRITQNIESNIKVKEVLKKIREKEREKDKDKGEKEKEIAKQKEKEKTYEKNKVKDKDMDLDKKVSNIVSHENIESSRNDDTKDQKETLSKIRMKSEHSSLSPSLSYILQSRKLRDMTTNKKKQKKSFLFPENPTSKKLKLEKEDQEKEILTQEESKTPNYKKSRSFKFQPEIFSLPIVPKNITKQLEAINEIQENKLILKKNKVEKIKKFKLIEEKEREKEREKEKEKEKERELFKARMKALILVKTSPTVYFKQFIISGGNNCGLVKNILEDRFPDWKEVPSYNNNLYFKWVFFSRFIKFEQLGYSQKQIVNHFEFHQEITNKDNLFKNLFNYCESKKLCVYDFVPLTFALDVNEKSFNSDVEKFCKCFNYMKTEMTKNSPELVNNINKNLWKYYTSNDRRMITYCRPKIYLTHLSNRNLWLLKPTGFNRGRGVIVFEDLEQLKKYIKEYSEGVEERIPNLKNVEEKIQDGAEQEMSKNKVVGIIKSNTFVIQKYIEKPLLIENRKFDIRTWVLVNHEMKVFLFKEGYLRTSSQEYSMTSDSISNRSIHLTNNAVQKYCTGYGNFEEGNQISFNRFQEYLEKKYSYRNINVRKNLYTQMKELVEISMQSVRKKINPNDRHYCFEIFGYDFIIDSDFKVWLIEINTNPCLEESSNILKMLLPRMISSLNR